MDIEFEGDTWRVLSEKEVETKKIEFARENERFGVGGFEHAGEVEDVELSGKFDKLGTKIWSE